MSDPNTGVSTVAYGTSGAEVESTSAGALAKATTDNETGNARYWLKYATGGPDAGHLYNPQSPTFNAGQARRFRPESGRAQYEFRRVTKESFDLYLRFLRTGNLANLRQAERA